MLHPLHLTLTGPVLGLLDLPIPTMQCQIHARAPHLESTRTFAPMLPPTTELRPMGQVRWDTAIRAAP